MISVNKRTGEEDQCTSELEKIENDDRYGVWEEIRLGEEDNHIRWHQLQQRKEKEEIDVTSHPGGISAVRPSQKKRDEKRLESERASHHQKREKDSSSHDPAPISREEKRRWWIEEGHGTSRRSRSGTL